VYSESQEEAKHEDEKKEEKVVCLEIQTSDQVPHRYVEVYDDCEAWYINTENSKCYAFRFYWLVCNELYLLLTCFCCHEQHI